MWVALNVVLSLDGIQAVYWLKSVGVHALQAHWTFGPGLDSIIGGNMAVGRAISGCSAMATAHSLHEQQVADHAA